MPAAAQKDKDKRFEEIKSEAQRLMDEIKVPGVAIGIIHDGKVEMAGLGITNIDDPQPVNENTVFYIGSMTKPFTSTVVLKMSEHGELGRVQVGKIADLSLFDPKTVTDHATYKAGDTGTGDELKETVL